MICIKQEWETVSPLKIISIWTHWCIFSHSRCCRSQISIHQYDRIQLSFNYSCINQIIKIFSLLSIHICSQKITIQYFILMSQQIRSNYFILCRRSFIFVCWYSCQHSEKYSLFFPIYSKPICYQCYSFSTCCISCSIFYSSCICIATSRSFSCRISCSTLSRSCICVAISCSFSCCVCSCSIFSRSCICITISRSFSYCICSCSTFSRSCICITISRSFSYCICSCSIFRQFLVKLCSISIISFIKINLIWIISICLI